MELNYETLAQRFSLFADVECRDYEPLYDALSLAMTESPELLAVASAARPGQPVPNLFFGAVHYLLVQQPQHPLARYYADLSAAPLSPEAAFDDFRSFVLENEAAIRSLIAERIVQTNEVGRSAVLLPALNYISQRTGDKPIALIEVGASGGLLLLMDMYHIDYGRLSWGDPASTVRLTCRLESEIDLPLRAGYPVIGQRAGIDLNPIDFRDEESVLWLKALVWPSIPERSTALENASALAVDYGLEILKGDALDVLPSAIAAAPPDMTVVVLHSHTLNQFDDTAKARFHDILRQASIQRDIVRLGEEGQRPAGLINAHVYATLWHDGQGEDVELAQCHAHGRYLKWIAQEDNDE